MTMSFNSLWRVLAVRQKLDKALLFASLFCCFYMTLMQRTDVTSKSCLWGGCFPLLQRRCDVAPTGTGRRERLEVSDSRSQHKHSLFFFLRPCCLFIFFLQQQITEAVLKIKVLFSCSCKKKTKSAQNSNDGTKRSVNMPCKWWGEEQYCWKNLFCLFQ